MREHVIRGPDASGGSRCHTFRSPSFLVQGGSASLPDLCCKSGNREPEEYDADKPPEFPIFKCRMRAASRKIMVFPSECRIFASSNAGSGERPRYRFSRKCLDCTRRYYPDSGPMSSIKDGMGTMRPVFAAERYSIASGCISMGEGGTGRFGEKMPDVRTVPCNGKKSLAEREVSPVTY